MDKVTIYKNKGETFRCNLKIDGAEIKDTVVRLCLEFKSHPNYFFYGELKDNGECVIEIPRLKNLDEKEGKLTVEAIADSVYFKVYEAQLDLRNSVELSMDAPTIKTVKMDWKPPKLPSYKSYAQEVKENVYKRYRGYLTK